MNKNIRDLTGQTFGRLTVIEHDSTIKSKQCAYWKVQCTCGNVKSVRRTSLTNGRSKSCGCYNLEKSRELLPDNQAAYNSLYKSYKHNAKRRNYSFDISMEDFRLIIAQPCHYCGIAPYQTHRHDGTSKSVAVFNGLDRVNNTIGYTTDNVVPCCGICNRAKDTMSYGEFIAWIERTYTHLH